MTAIVINETAVKVKWVAPKDFSESIDEYEVCLIAVNDGQPHAGTGPCIKQRKQFQDMVIKYNEVCTLFFI